MEPRERRKTRGEMKAPKKEREGRERKRKTRRRSQGTTRAMIIAVKET